jgi:ribonuclease P protein component
LTKTRESFVIQGLLYSLLGTCHETHLSTFRGTTQTYSRVSCANAHSWRPRGYSCTPCQRPSSFERLISRFVSQQRLHHSREFADVLGSRLFVRGINFALHHKGSELARARLGLVLPKRLARLAVTRNLIRRQAREVFRCHAESLPPIDLVLRLTKILKPSEDVESLKRACRTEIETLLARVREKNAPTS